MSQLWWSHWTVPLPCHSIDQCPVLVSPPREAVGANNAYFLHTLCRHFTLHLSPNRKIFSPDFVVYVVDGWSNWKQHLVDTDEFYRGYLEGKLGWEWEGGDEEGRRGNGQKGEESSGQREEESEGSGPRVGGMIDKTLLWSEWQIDGVTSFISTRT